MTDLPEDRNNRVFPPPSAINTNFVRPWSLITPSVYRYEDKKWIDLFFENGSFRLSTFAQFSKYKDEIRGDKHEGSGVCYGMSPNGQCIMIHQAQGIGAFILSLTHRLDRAMRSSFGRDSAFQIMNTVGFAHEVSRQLPGFRFGLEGSCIYRTERVISRSFDFDMERYKTTTGEYRMPLTRDFADALGGPELILLKSKKYEAQSEYRMMWEVDSLANDFIDISIPNARQFCRRVEDDEY